MSEFREFFRHCPSCGRRFQITLVGEKLIDERRVTDQIERDTEPISSASSTFRYGGVPMPEVVVEEDVPVTIDIKEFQYTYKCKHCGHVWTETHEKDSETPPP
jgi:uncharacterized Zn finger protein